IGFDLKPLDPKALAEKTDILLIFGSKNSDYSSLAESRSILDNIKTKVLFSSSSSDLDPFFDIVFPTALIAEKGGSLTNTEGKVQRFSPALEAPGESLPEWKLLVDLAKELGKNISYYGQFTSPEAISREMEKEVPFFGKKNE
ncbi:MAG: molybdopterin-dependent oxidoreductase, partial [Candidatus Aminicenantes bacterium]|nr:molybdopterin-dependent oxidoreductase [Candidatus Aminicenantes bacterium]